MRKYCDKGECQKRDLESRIAMLEAALTNIVEVYDMRAEIFTMHDDIAANLAARARKALETIDK